MKYQEVNCPECDAYFDAKIEEENTIDPVEFLEWTIKNVERYEEIAGVDHAIYMGKMVTLSELFDIYKSNMS